MEEATCSADVKSAVSLESPPSSITPDLRRFLKEGGSLQAQLRQFSSNLPPAFTATKSEFSPVLSDFKFLKDAESEDIKLGRNARLRMLYDKSGRELGEVCRQAFDLLYQVVNFHQRVSELLEDIDMDKYTQKNLDAIAQDQESLPLFIELLYTVGTILLLVDRCLPGLTRERLVVAYVRHNNCLDLILKNEPLQRLCRKTGYIPGTRLPQGYPESYLLNFPIPEKIVHYALKVLLQKDIYSTLKHYLNSSHRTTAMSQQAAYMFVLLYFVPDVLSRDTEIMKQVVDRFFSDRWVVSWVSGYTANLRFEWDAYRAAKNALRSVLSGGKGNKICQEHWEKVNTLSSELERSLKISSLQADGLPRHSSDTFSLVREANVTLRWILLHSFSDKWTPDAAEGNSVAKLLLNLSTLELEMFHTYQQLIESRQNRIDSASKLVRDGLKVLIESNSASQDQPASSQQESHVLYWLKSLYTELETLSTIPSSESGDKIRSIPRTFDEIVNFGQLDNGSPSGRRLLSDIRHNLVVIQQLMGIRKEHVDTLKVASDFSYAFHLFQNEHFIKLIQGLVRRDPADLEKVGSLLIKMRSVLDISSNGERCGSDDPAISGLNKYYESQLRTFGERILDHVPDCVCNALDQMTVIRTRTQKLLRSGSDETPRSRFGLVVKLSEEKDKNLSSTSKSYAKLAGLAAEIALFSTGLNKVETCLGDTMPLELRENLEFKIRNHVAKRLSSLANQKLQFAFAAPPFTFQNVTLRGSRQIGMGQAFSGAMSGKEEFDTRMIELKEVFDGLLHSMECTQDCLDLPGCALWHNELSRVIAINLRREYKQMVGDKTCNSGGKRQVAATDPDSPLTFLGRLAREIVRLTSPGATHYSVQRCCWLDAGGTEVFGISSMEKLRHTIGVQGLVALDCLIATRVRKLMRKLHDLCVELGSLQTSGQKPLSTYAKELQSCTGLSVPLGGAMWYVDAVYSVGSRIWSPILEVVAAIGQSQLLRKLIALECRNVSLLEAPVAFHRTMQLLSDFVENKDADFSSSVHSQDGISHQAVSTGGQDSSSVVSGSTFVVHGNRSDEDMSPRERQAYHKQRPLSEAQRTFSNSPRARRDLAFEPGVGSSGSMSSSLPVELPDSVHARNSTHLGTITESKSRTERNLSFGTQTGQPQLAAAASPSLSASSVRLSHGAESSQVNKQSEQAFDALNPSRGARVPRKSIFGIHSEASSSILSEPVWDPSQLGGRSKRPTSDASGLQVPSEASSQYLFFSSVDLSLLGDSGDQFTSLPLDAGDPVLHGAGPEGVFQVLQSTGLLNAMETRYVSDILPVAEVPIILFLATVSIVHKYEFNKQSASLMRQLGSTIPDAKSFIHGLVTILYQVPSVTDQFLRHVGQYVRAYLKTATGATAQGIAAAGVKMVLPQEVQRTVAFVCEMCEVGGWSRKRTEKFIPPFLLDVWMLGV